MIVTGKAPVLDKEAEACGGAEVVSLGEGALEQPRHGLQRPANDI
jgi:hypothetical protein